MRYYTNQIDQLLNHIENHNIMGILLYGPDKGYISKISKMIKNKFNLYETEIKYNELNASYLKTILNTKNFFNQRELIKINEVTNSINESLKKELENEFLHFPIFIGDDLNKNSSLRKYFEVTKNLAIIGCYNDDSISIGKIVTNICEKNGKKISEEALNYLKINLSGDHGIILSEIEKLITFTIEKTSIEIDDVNKTISPNINGSGDELCIYLALKNPQEFINEFEKLKLLNINIILIVRAIIRFYLNIYVVNLHLENGLHIEEALKKLSPPIFFKYINNFIKIIKNTDITTTVKILYILNNVEIKLKLYPTEFDIIKDIYLPIGKL